MSDIIVKPAKKEDIPDILNIHMGEDDPWSDKKSCESWINRRLERGFYIQAGLYDGRLVGHGEWVLSDEPRGKYLYLGVMQIEGDYRRRGVGRAMIDNAVKYARKNGCEYLSTIPDEDMGSENFYLKCGFHTAREFKSCEMQTKNRGGDISVRRIPEVPFSAVSEKTFVFGLNQASSRHMWEVLNRKPDTDDRLTPAVCVNGDTYMQLSYFEGNESGAVLCWTTLEEYETVIKNALAFGADAGLKQLNFTFDAKLSYLFEMGKVTHSGYEMVLGL